MESGQIDQARNVITALLQIPLTRNRTDADCVISLLNIRLLQIHTVDCKFFEVCLFVFFERYLFVCLFFEVCLFFFEKFVCFLRYLFVFEVFVCSFVCSFVALYIYLLVSFEVTINYDSLHKENVCKSDYQLVNDLIYDRSHTLAVYFLSILEF